MRPTPPCKGCKDRHEGCQALCAAYSKYVFDNEEYKRKVNEQKEADLLHQDYMIERSRRVRK